MCASAPSYANPKPVFPTISPSPNPPHLTCAASGFAKNPSPFPTTSFRGSTTTSRESKLRSSGVMTFLGSAAPPSGFLPPCTAFAAVDAAAAAIAAGVRRGAGKLDFLSMASMRRWNLRKSASARMRVDSRSILPESSLTVSVGQCRAQGLLENEDGAGNILYLRTSSKCSKCVMITSRCFSSIASATNK